MDVAIALSELRPGASFSGSLTTNSEQAYDSLTWYDNRPKPSWAELNAVWGALVAARDPRAMVNGFGGSFSIFIEERTVSGEDGGTFISGIWQTRNLNTIVEDSAGLVSLSGGIVTLAPIKGAFNFMFSSGAYRVDGHQARLYDITHQLGDDAWVGTTENTKQSMTWSQAEGLLYVPEETQFALQHFCESRRNGNGLGASLNNGAVEKFAYLKFWR